jgi:uncharacterized protein
MRAPVVSLIRAASLIGILWKNGGGTTREIAVSPPDAAFDSFDWRVSMAEVEQSGPFSLFPGVDRTLVLLTGSGMRLAEDNGIEHVLDEPFEMASFAGEARIDASLAAGPTRDFNVMTRRARMSASVRVQRGVMSLALPHAVTLLHCAHGTLDVAIADQRYRLDIGDTLQIEGPCPRVACAGAAWIEVGLNPTLKAD